MAPNSAHSLREIAWMYGDTTISEEPASGDSIVSLPQIFAKNSVALYCSEIFVTIAFCTGAQGAVLVAERVHAWTNRFLKPCLGMVEVDLMLLLMVLMEFQW